jgi:hypothetical protein
MEWTGWDLNPRLPACKAGDLPLIYRPMGIEKLKVFLCVSKLHVNGCKSTILYYFISCKPHFTHYSLIGSCSVLHSRQITTRLTPQWLQ